MLTGSPSRQILALPFDVAPAKKLRVQAAKSSAASFKTPGSDTQKITATFHLDQRLARYRSEMGLFWVDDAQGRIGTLKPGDRGYVKAALDPARRVKIFERTARPGTEVSLKLPADRYYGMYLIPNGSSAAWDRVQARGKAGAGPLRPLLSFAAANPSHFANLAQGHRGRIAWEDTAGGGDRDFNDVVFRVAYSVTPTPIPNPTDAPPTVTISQPAADQLFSHSPTIAGHVADDHGVTSVRAVIHGPSQFTSDVDVTFDAATGAFAFPAPTATDGSYSVTLTATDTQGATSLSAHVSFTLDTTPPPITFRLAPESDTSPAGDDQTELNQVRLVGETEPRLTVVLAGTGLSTQADAAGSFSFDAVPLASLGAATFIARATDAAGNTGQASRQVTRIAKSGFEEGLPGWDVSQDGGTDPNPGSVDVVDGRAVLVEGDSFQVTLSRTFTVPENPTTISFTYDDLKFDTSDPSFINDAFEAALLGDNGRSSVGTIGAGRDAFFNITEGMNVAKGSGVTVAGQQVTVDISDQIPGSTARLVFRLVNNDSDTTTSVAIVSASTPAPIAGTKSAETPAAAVFARPSSSRALLPGASSAVASTSAPEVSSGQGGAGSVSPTESPNPADTPIGSDGRVVFTTSADFSLGTSFNVNASEVPDELRLDPPGEARTYPFIWISNSDEGTVSRFDTRTGQEIGRYRTGPSGGAHSPSRTAVASDGSVWVANRAFGIQASVVHVLLDDYIDRNHNGVLDTSTDLNGTGVIDPDEVLPWDANGDGLPDDERIAASVLVGRDRSTLAPQSDGVTRAITIDANDDVWVGLFNFRQYEVYDHTTGALKGIVPVSGTPYGAVIDGGGILWGATRGSFFDRIDTATGTASTVSHGGGDNYGITVDARGVIWTAAYSSKQLIRYDPSNGTVDAYDLPGNGRGVGAAADGTIWVATNAPDLLARFNFDADGRTLLNSVAVSVGSVATAAVIDADGYVWTTTYGDNKAWKIDPATNAVVPGWPINTGRTPYNYSDMTGQVRLTVTERTGTWTEIIDGVRDGVPWATVGVDSDLPARTSTRLRVRASDQPDGLAALPWLEVDPDSRFSGIQGRYLQVEVTLRSTDPAAMPAIRSIEVVSIPTPQVIADAPAQAEAGTSFVLSGQAIAAQPALPSGARARNAITHVLVNGQPVDMLDAAGRFFTRITVQPGQNQLVMTAYDLYNQAGSQHIVVERHQRNPGVVDFSTLSDITASFRPEYARTSFARGDAVLHADVAVRNVGRYPVDAPLYVAVANLTDPSVVPLNVAGYTPDGLPYYDATGLVPGHTLIPGGATGNLGFAFFNPDRGQFRYDLRFFGLLNRAPQVTTVPMVDGYAGKTYSYDAAATDPDGDAVVFSLVTAPQGMTVAGGTGVIAWSPTAANIGTHTVVVRVDDGRGGFVDQQFDVTVTTPPPNRPPVFTSLPVGTAYVGNRYTYAVAATDADGDELAFSIVSAPTGVSIDPNTGLITWTPLAVQLGDARVVVEVSDGHGGTARQDYPLCVMAGPGNHAPVIVSQPTTTIAVPTQESGAPGDPLILTTWTPIVFPDAQPSLPSWVIDSTGTVATQLYNANASILLGDFDLAGGAMEGVLRVSPTGDDDFIGFVFGYQDAQHFYLFEWKQASQDGAHQGMSVRVINSPSPVSGFELSEQVDTGGRVRSIYQNDVPWSSSVDYTFHLDFDRGNFRIRISQNDGTLVADVSLEDQTYQSGRFGFYNRSQDSVVYSGFRRQAAPSSTYNYHVEAVDPDGDTLTYRLTQKPEGMTIDETTGQIEWVLPPTTSATYPVAVRVEDGRGGSNEQSYVLVVNPAAGSITGRVWLDVDGNGTQVPGDPGIAGWTVYLDQNHNGLRDSDEKSTVSAADGSYSFTGLDAGSYSVREEQRQGWNQTSPVTTVTGPDLIIDGSFEDAPDPGPFVQYPIGSTAISGWTVVGATISYHSDRVTVASDGTRSVDLDGDNSAGGIAQTIDTIPGRYYKLTFDMAGNPDGGPTVKRMRVSASGQSADFSFNISGFSRSNMGWTPQEWVFKADSNKSTIVFQSLDNPGPTGPMIDRVAAFELLAMNGHFEVSLATGQTIDGLDFGNQQIAGAANNNPVFARQPLDTAAVGRLYRDTPPATDPDGDSLTFDLPVAPPGMTVHPTLGTLVWTPTADQVGSFPVVLRVQDGKGGVALQSFNVDVGAANLPPVVTSTPPGPAKVGSPYEYRIRAQDPEGDAIGFRLASGPANLSVDPATGLVSFVPTAGQVGTAPVVVDVTGGTVTTYTFSIAVAADPANADPVFSSTPRKLAWLGLSYDSPVDASDPDGDPLTYRMVKGPIGMTLDTTSAVGDATALSPAVLRWRPGAADVGKSFDVELAVADGRGGEKRQSFRVEVLPQGVNRAPRVVSNPKAAGTGGRPYAFDLKADDPDGDPVLWRIVSGPPGMSVDPKTGAVRWTPTADQLGPNAVVVEARDPYAATATQSFAVLVACMNQPPMIASRPPTEAWNDEPYLYAVRADDPEGDAPTFRLLAAPDGMTIGTSTGLIRWSPSFAAVTTARVVVEVDDGQGNTAIQTYDVVARAAARNRPPVITSQPRASAAVGTAYRYDVTATDPEGRSIVYALVAKADGMEIDPDAGLITWSPADDDLGDRIVSVSATDPAGARALQTFLLHVTRNQAPTLAAIPDQVVSAGTTHRYDVHASDPNGDTLAYSLSGGPSGMTIDGLGRIAWKTPASYSGLNPVSVTVTASDPGGLSASRTYAVTVQPDVEAPRVLIAVSGSPVDRGTTVRFRVTATDNVAVSSLGLTLDGQPLALDAAGYAARVMDAAGLFRLVGTAKDAAGNVGTSAPLEVRVLAPGDATWPEVAIASPDPASPETTVAYLTQVKGSVQDDNLVFWRLEYARVDRVDLNNLVPEGTENGLDPNYTVIASGTRNVQDAVLGVFDPTLLVDAPYVIRLIAGDVNGHVTARGAIVNVAGAAKIGNFHLEFTDLQVPLAGIPITVTRVYDTMQAGDEGDFGYGWKLGLQDAQVLETVAPGGDFVPGKTKVYLTNPEGRRVGFTYQERFISGFWGFGGVFDPYFVPDPGVTDTLDVPGQVGRGGAAGALEGAYNPNTYVLTTKEGLVYTYDQTKGLQTVVDLNGNSLAFTDSGIVHSSGAAVKFVRDYRGRITEIHQVDASGEKVGESVTYTYDAAGDLKTQTNQAGLTTRYDYLSAPNAHYLDSVHDLSRTDSNDPTKPLRTLKVVYQDKRFVKIVDASGKTVDQRDYDLEKRTAIVHDGNGNATTLIYDDRGNVLTETDALGGAITREYGDSRNPDLETKTVDKLGYITERKYDASGNVLEIREIGTAAKPFAKPIVTAFTYDRRGNVTSIKNDKGQTSTFVYDDKGRLTKLTNAQGDSSSFTYDDQGRRESLTDFNGNESTFFYDGGCPCGSPGTILFDDETYEELQYNEFGQTILDAYYEKDGALAEITTTKYDALGREIEVARGQGADQVVTRKFYKGNLLDHEIVVNPASPDETRDTPVAQRKSRITAYDYDANGRTIRQINPDGGTVEFRYDAQGNRILLMDPVGNVTTWVYDDLNRVVEERDPFYWRAYTTGKTPAQVDLDAIIAANRNPSGVDLAADRGAAHVTAYGYDGGGNQTEKIDRDGRRSEFDYDQAGRLTEERWYDADTGALSRTISWKYDSLGNLIAASDPDSRYVYTYDALNRMTSVDNTGTPDAPVVVLTYQYDHQGNVISTSDDAGVTVASSYDRRNRLAVRTWYGGGVDSVRIEFGYNAAGRQTLLKRFASLDETAPAGRTVTTHLTNGQVDALTHEDATDAVLASYDYGYDFGGLVVSEARTNQDHAYDQTIDYKYDLNGQLTDADYDTQPDEHFVYDLNGNRILSKTGDVTTLYTTGTANQLMSNGQFRYEYDGEGNLVKKTTVEQDGTDGVVTTYRYDHHNHLLQVDDWSRNPGDPVQPSSGSAITQSVEYSYDMLGRRTTKVVNADEVGNQPKSQENYIYNNANVWADTSSTETVSHYLFTNTLDHVVARSQVKGTQAFYLSDRVGTIRDTVDVSSSRVTHIEFTSFGNALLQLHQPPPSRYLFTGREFDTATMLYYYRARTFDSATGRFLNYDPVNLRPYHTNLYSYVSNAPLTATDPSGASDLIDVAIEAAAIVTITNAIVEFTCSMIFGHGKAEPLSIGLDSPAYSGLLTGGLVYIGLALGNPLAASTVFLAFLPGTSAIEIMKCLSSR